MNGFSTTIKNPGDKRMLIKDMLRMNASRMPNKNALVMGEKSLSYGQLNIRVNRLSRGMLALSMHKGDRVAVLTHNSIEYYEIYLALSKIGGVMVPFNNLLREREFIRDFSYIRPRFIFFEPEFSPIVTTV